MGHAAVFLAARMVALLPWTPTAAQPLTAGRHAAAAPAAGRLGLAEASQHQTAALQGDLHAIFLYYCMLDSGFARFWPPQLTLNGWLAFMKASVSALAFALCAVSMVVACT